MDALDEAVGHGTTIATLRSAITLGTLPHAILLTGPTSVGKTTLARRVAEILLDAQAWPGGGDAHPDLWCEDGDTERIGIDRIRAGARGTAGEPGLQDFLGMRPYAGGRRVAIIGRADRLTEQAANCLLKSLEEPPKGSHLILCSAHPERLPATILSRCQAHPLAAVAAVDIRSWLERRHGIDPKLAATVAALAQGRPGRALRLGAEPGALGAEVGALDALLAVGGTGLAGALRAAAELAPPAGAEGRDRALLQLAVWSSFVRDVACYAAGAPDLAVWSAYRGALEKWAAALAIERAITIFGRCVTVTEQLGGYANPRLAYEVLFLEIFGTVPAPPRIGPADRDSGLAPAAVAGPGRPRSQVRRR